MENRAGNPLEISRKSRSLDLQSLYKSTASVEQGDNKRKSGVVDDGKVRKKKRKSRRGVPLSSLEPEGKKSREILDEDCRDGVSSDSPNSGKLQSWLSQKLSSSRGFNSISLNLDDGGGNIIQIPKRRRGFVGRKRVESVQVSRSLGSGSGRVGGSSADQITKLNGECKKSDENGLGPPDGEVSSADQIAKSNDDFASKKVVHPKLKGKKGVESVQVSRSLGNGSGRVGGSSADQITKLNGECKKSDENGLGHPDGEVSSADRIAKSNDDSASKKVVHPKVKGKRVIEDLKVDSTSRVNSARHAKEEGGHLIVNNKGDTSSRKSHKNHRKRTYLALGSESLAKKMEHLADSPNTISHNSHDEDEENLEQNAARMLSSRFDPSCTGIPSKSSSFASPSRNGSSFVVSSADIASRTLRPRTYHKGKGLFRKRRHFYEILSKDVDAYWVLNRRIKIFWPLDESWYYGLVNEYDPRRDLHHIKYDDRDEEWINLQNERFKLLVFPSEIPRKMEPERGTMGNRHDNYGKRDSDVDDDSFIGCYTDSEPIISWLTRSSRRVKSSPLGVSKRCKTSHQSSNFVPLVSSSKTNGSNVFLDMGFAEKDTHESSNSALPDRSIDARRGKKSVLEGTKNSKGGKLPIVYFRRRFHKKGEASPLAPTVLGHTDSEGLLWSVDNSGLLKLTTRLVESKEFRFELGSSVSDLRYIGGDDSWLLRTMLLLHYGTITTTWPTIHLEMLFVDNFDGLRFLLFECCLKRAMTFVFLILTVFDQPNEQRKYADMQIPVTSIRFKLSCIEDFRKQHVFAFFSFSKVKKSKWLLLDSELRQHCLLTKRLPVSECTYDNIKALEGGWNQMHRSSIDGELSAFEGWRKKSTAGVITLGALKGSSGVAMNQCSSNSAVKHGEFLPFALSFSAAPTFFLSLHLKLLMENSVACISLREHDFMYSRERSENTGCPDRCTLIEGYSECASEITPQCNSKTAESRGWLPCPMSQVGTHANSECNDGGLGKSSLYFQNGKLSMDENFACSGDPAGNSSHIVQSQESGCSNLKLKQRITSPEPLACENLVSVCMPDSRCYSSLTGLSVEIPFLDQFERPANGKTPNSTESTDLAWNVSDAIGHNPYPRGPRSIWHHNRDSLNSSSGDASQLWPNGRTYFIRSGFGNGPKKPRTQVHYTLPSGVFGLSAKHKMHTRKGVPSKRIRKASEKQTLDDSRNSRRRNLELLACDANVLITIGDRGWRECGARIVLELADHNEWRLAIKLSGTTKYSHKAHQFLQPGSTNRYTHAMMWKGGKDWVLEFPDRSQWILFKEMHEECYNRNVRAASVKNIPIPGVRLIEESDDSGTELPFIRSSPMYFQQVETDVEMAMDPVRILYDMDSDDEQWISEHYESSRDHGSKCEDISEELFEKTMDAFEKVAYAEQREYFTSDELEKFMGGVGPLEVIKLIHEHWRLKRQRKGMPLIRHLQPPLWECYEKQVKEWEHAMAKGNTTLSNGCQDKAPPMEKPTIYAFCLKPRGLEVPNKGSKQRSHRKFPVSGHSHAFLGDHDGLHAFGRRLNGYGFGDEKVMFQGNSPESSDASPLFQPSRAFSPRDCSGSGYFSVNNDWSDWNHPKLHRNKSKKIGTILSPSPNSPQMLASYNQRTTIGKRNGVHRWHMPLPEWPSQKHYQSDGSLRQGLEPLDGSNIDEFRLRDPSGAAHLALTMARRKRENAQRLLYRADVAIHKAVVALTTAEAIKAAFSEDSSCIEKDD